MKKMLLLCCSLTLMVALHAQIIHVPTDYPSIQQGINAATSGDTVLVADGTYYEQINFKGKKPLMVASEFLLDGDTSHISHTILDGSQISNPENASVVYFITNEDTTSVFCGFTVRNGRGTTSQGMRSGGGIFIEVGAGAKIINNHITHNTANDTLVANTAYAWGGGIASTYSPSDTWIVIENNLIDYNKTFSSLYQAGSAGIDISFNCRISNNIISDNSSLSYGNAPDLGAYGGAMILYNDPSFGNFAMNIVNGNVIKNNTIEGWETYGGAIFQRLTTVDFQNNVVLSNHAISTGGTKGAGGGLSLSDLLEGSVISNNTFKENTSTRFAGGVDIEISDQEPQMVSVENNYFIGNTAKSGGGLSITNTPVTLLNNVFSGNHAENNGGAVNCEKTTALLPGKLVTFINNSFSGNKADQKGGAIYTGPSVTVEPLVINSILWCDKASEGAEVFLANALDELEIASSDFNPGLVHGGIHDGLLNFSGDPLFTDTVNLIPSLASPVIDKGTESYLSAGNEMYFAPLYDITGTSRPWGLGFDMGAHEYGFTGIHKEAAKNLEIFPNPFTNSVTISFSNDEASHVLLQVFDNYGRLIAVPVDAEQPQGEQKIEWNAGNLPSGIYYCRLQAGERPVSSKIIKTK